MQAVREHGSRQFFVPVWLPEKQMNVRKCYII